MNFEDYQDEFRDFFLLFSNQLLLSIFMTELPVESYEIQVFTDTCKLAETPVILHYNWVGGINNELGDTRRWFHLYCKVEPFDEEFKLIVYVRFTKMGEKFYPTDNIRERKFTFLPTDKSGEAIVNETLIWIKEVMVDVMSGKN